MEKFTSNNTGIDNFVKNNSDATVARFGHLNAIVDNLNNNINSGIYTPTVSDEVSCTAGFTDIGYVKIANNTVIMFGSVLARLDGGSTSCSFKIDVAKEAEPNNVWNGVEIFSSVISRTNDVLNSECFILSDFGTKLLTFSLSDISAGTTLKLNFQIMYRVDN